MKKLLSFLLVMVLCAMPLSLMGGCSGKETLSILSQGEYMDKNIFKEFEAYYLAETGKTIQVEIDDAQHNEDMLTRIEVKKQKYDLICPSDYMIENMMSKNLLLPTKTNIDFDATFRPEFLAISKIIDKDMQYMVPYMFGTLGIMYNTKSITTPINSWDAIYTDKLIKQGKTVSTKKSNRDSYIASQIYGLRDTLSAVSNNFEDNDTPEYKAHIQEIFENTSDDRFNLGKSTLQTQKDAKVYYDDDDLKYDMAINKQDAGMFWSCDAGYVMNDYVDDSDNVLPGNKNLWYEIPKEGGNVYVDGFVIPKYAKNQDAANMFLEFLCRKENAIANSVYIGAVSTVTAAYDEMKAEKEAEVIKDKDGNEVSAEWKAMYMDMLFPSEETLNRCGTMRYYGDKESKIIQMVIDIMNL